LGLGRVGARARARVRVESGLVGAGVSACSVCSSTAAARLSYARVCSPRSRKSAAYLAVQRAPGEGQG